MKSLEMRLREIMEKATELLNSEDGDKVREGKIIMKTLNELKPMSCHQCETITNFSCNCCGSEI